MATFKVCIFEHHRTAKLEVTDGYIRKDWSIVDRTIQKVMERVMRVQ